MHILCTFLKWEKCKYLLILLHLYKPSHVWHYWPCSKFCIMSVSLVRWSKETVMNAKPSREILCANQTLIWICRYGLQNRNCPSRRTSKKSLCKPTWKSRRLTTTGQKNIAEHDCRKNPFISFKAAFWFLDFSVCSLNFLDTYTWPIQ